MARARAALWIAGQALFAVWLLWTALTLWFSNLPSAAARGGLTAAYLLLVLGALLALGPRRGVWVALAASLMVALAFFLTRPSNERDWMPEVAVTPRLELDGDRVRVLGVRNFHYRSETDFDQRWEDREYRLSELESIDLVMSYWGPVDYCHTFLSFGFQGGEQLAISVETRKEVGETYSTWAGFFKRYELIYIFGDERDLIGQRAVARGEDVYLYRLRARPEMARELFLSYLRFADDLSRRPQFYGVLQNSCGVNILHRVAETGRRVMAGRDALLNGYWDRHLYQHGVLDQGLPFEELREHSRIVEAARAAWGSPDFSQRIREGRPGIGPPGSPR